MLCNLFEIEKYVFLLNHCVPRARVEHCVHVVIIYDANLDKKDEGMRPMWNGSPLRRMIFKIICKSMAESFNKT